LPTSIEIRAAARTAITELIGREVTDDESVVSSGLIDSLSILRLITSLEGKLGIGLSLDRVQPDDFDSVDLIAETVFRVGKTK
jgi:acyl carrier protein